MGFRVRVAAVHGLNSPLWCVAAQGRFIKLLGRLTFALGPAMAIALDLRARGYADAHVQRHDPEAPIPAMALTAIYRRAS